MLWVIYKRNIDKIQRSSITTFTTLAGRKYNGQNDYFVYTTQNSQNLNFGTSWRK